MVSYGHLGDLIAARTTRRRETALSCVSKLVHALEGESIDVIGSLASGAFKSHSDVDLLVRGKLDPERRARIERAAANAFRGSGLPYDLIFVADLTPEQAKEFEHDAVEASCLCKALAETQTSGKGAGKAGSISRS